MLICAGSRRYHGSLILAIRAAVRFCDLVYVYCEEKSGDNRVLVRKLKISSPNIIILRSSHELSLFLPRMDAILAGPGWEENGANKRLLRILLKSGKPIVLDSGALALMSGSAGRSLRRFMHSGCLLTPHRGEFKRLTRHEAGAASVRAAARSMGCTILCKGPIDLISYSSRFKINTTHHAGMTKGGSGDTLAGLCAALMADHNEPFMTACASIYLLGLCGVRLSKRMGAHYSSEDLVDELPMAACYIEKRR